MEKTPDPVWSLQLNSLQYRQYYGKRLRGNTICCNFIFALRTNILLLLSLVPEKGTAEITHKLFLFLFFLPNWIDNILPNLARIWTYFVSIVWYQERQISSRVPSFGAYTPIGRFFSTYCSVLVTIRHPNACFLVPFDSHTMHCAPCQIWRQVVHLRSEK
jgi:hypothetical protein